MEINVFEIFIQDYVKYTFWKHFVKQLFLLCFRNADHIFLSYSYYWQVWIFFAILLLVAEVAVSGCFAK